MIIRVLERAMDYQGGRGEKLVVDQINVEMSTINRHDRLMFFA